jgi:hypothetical protein
MIFSVLVSASAVDTNGAAMAGARPAAPAMALVVFRKSRRDQFCLFPPDPIAQLLFDRVDVGGDACCFVVVVDERIGAPPAQGELSVRSSFAFLAADRMGADGHLFHYRSMDMRFWYGKRQSVTGLSSSLGTRSTLLPHRTRGLRDWRIE